jgi:hypothetical protein
MLVWTGDDYEHHKCRADQIGTPKNVAQGASNTDIANEVLAALPPLSMAEFRQACLRVARGTMGYDAFLLKYPGFLQKALLVMMRESTPPPPPLTAPIIDIPWLTNTRFAYKREKPDLELIDNAEIIKPPEPPST